MNTDQTEIIQDRIQQSAAKMRVMNPQFLKSSEISWLAQQLTA